MPSFIFLLYLNLVFSSHQDIGGCDIQKQEIREAVELPLTHHELYKQIGIDPPRGVLLYGPPGTGKTMLAKAVAHHTTAAFIRVVGSEFVQKYLGEVCIEVMEYHEHFLLCNNVLLLRTNHLLLMIQTICTALFEMQFLFLRSSFLLYRKKFGR